MNQLVGPVLLRWALDYVNESGRQRFDSVYTLTKDGGGGSGGGNSDYDYEYSEEEDVNVTETEESFTQTEEWKSNVYRVESKYQRY